MTKRPRLEFAEPVVARELRKRLSGFNMDSRNPWHRMAKGYFRRTSEAAEKARWLEAFCGDHCRVEVKGTAWKGPFSWPCDMLPAVCAGIDRPDEFSSVPIVEFARRIGTLKSVMDGWHRPIGVFPGNYIALAASTAILPGRPRSPWAKRLPRPSNFEIDFGRALLKLARSAHEAIHIQLQLVAGASMCANCEELFFFRRKRVDSMGHVKPMDHYCSPACRQSAKLRRTKPEHGSDFSFNGSWDDVTTDHDHVGFRGVKTLGWLNKQNQEVEPFPPGLLWAPDRSGIEGYSEGKNDAEIKGVSGNLGLK